MAEKNDLDNKIATALNAIDSEEICNLIRQKKRRKTHRAKIKK